MIYMPKSKAVAHFGKVLSPHAKSLRKTSFRHLNILANGVVDFDRVQNLRKTTFTDGKVDGSYNLHKSLIKSKRDRF